MNRIRKRKEKHDSVFAEPRVQNIYDEDRQELKFTTMYPRVSKPHGEMQPEDYKIYAVGLDMKVA